MKLFLDTANVSAIEKFADSYPIIGVTTNPTLLSREEGCPLETLKKIRDIIGKDSELHIQLTETNCEAMLEEATELCRIFGENTFVKVPIGEVGLKVTSELSKIGIGVTETAIFTAGQALLAANAGADYVAPYVSRIENISGNGIETVSDIALIFASESIKTQILAASFKTVRQVIDTALAGAHTATVAPDVMSGLLSHPSSVVSIAGFDRDFKNAFGNKTLLEIIKG